MMTPRGKQLHIPHGNSGHNDHDGKVCFLIPDVLYHDGQFRTREEQDHVRDRIREYLEDDREGITERQRPLRPELQQL